MKKKHHEGEWTAEDDKQFEKHFAPETIAFDVSDKTLYIGNEKYTKKSLSPMRGIAQQRQAQYFAGAVPRTVLELSRKEVLLWV